MDTITYTDVEDVITDVARTIKGLSGSYRNIAKTYDKDDRSRKSRTQDTHAAHALLQQVVADRSLAPFEDAPNEVLDIVGYWVRSNAGSGRAPWWAPNTDVIRMNAYALARTNGVDPDDQPHEDRGAYLVRIMDESPESVALAAHLRSIMDARIRVSVEKLGHGSSILVWRQTQFGGNDRIEGEMELCRDSGKLERTDDGAWVMRPRFVSKYSPILELVSADGSVNPAIQDVLAYFKKDR